MGERSSRSSRETSTRRPSIREFFESARDLNERHAERIRDLRFD